MTTTELNTLQLLPASPILKKLEELERNIDRALDTASASAKYATATTIAARYGMSRRSVHHYLAGAVAAGALRVLKPTQPNGK